jgi:hypothetical protein
VALAAGLVAAYVSLLSVWQAVEFLSQYRSQDASVQVALTAARFGAPPLIGGAWIAALAPTSRWRIGLPFAAVMSVAAALLLALITAMAGGGGDASPAITAAAGTALLGACAGLLTTSKSWPLIWRCAAPMVLTIATYFVRDHASLRAAQRGDVWQKQWLVEDRAWQKQYRARTLPGVERRAVAILGSGRSVLWPPVGGASYRSLILVGRVVGADAILRFSSVDPGGTTLLVAQRRKLAGSANPRAGFLEMGLESGFAHRLRHVAGYSRRFEGEAGGVHYVMYVDHEESSFRYMRNESGYGNVAELFRRNPLWAMVTFPAPTDGGRGQTVRR